MSVGVLVFDCVDAIESKNSVACIGGSMWYADRVGIEDVRISRLVIMNSYQILITSNQAQHACGRKKPHRPCTCKLPHRHTSPPVHLSRHGRHLSWSGPSPGPEDRALQTRCRPANGTNRELALPQKWHKRGTCAARRRGAVAGRPLRYRRTVALGRGPHGRTLDSLWISSGAAAIPASVSSKRDAGGQAVKSRGVAAPENGYTTRHGWHTCRSVSRRRYRRCCRRWRPG